MDTARFERRMAGNFCLAVLALVSILGLVGCSNSKGKYAGKLKVEASPELEKKGVTLSDWRYSNSDKTFGVQLSASKDFGPPDKIDLRVEGHGTYSSPIAVKLKAGEKTWVDFSGSVAFGDPFENLPDDTKVILELRTR
jgi:hypothetical protein